MQRRPFSSGRKVLQATAELGNGCSSRLFSGQLGLNQNGGSHQSELVMMVPH